MAGHSKWANIRHRKGAQDAKRGKLFTRLIREITVAARESGADPAANPRLRTAIDNALSNNVPKDKIERALSRGGGGANSASVEEIRYEGYGPGGVAVLVDCMTDNRNRTVSEVRHAFNKFGGNLGTDGSVTYLFQKTGILSYPAGSNEDAIMEVALEAGVDDVTANDDGSIDVLVSPDAFVDTKQTMVDAGLVPEQAEVTMRPSTSVALDSETAEKMLKLFDALEDLYDVQNVYSNADISEDVLNQVA